MAEFLRKLLFFFLLFNYPYAFAQDMYEVTLADVSQRVVSINAILFPKNDTLLMAPYGATHLKNGWATFIRDLNATNTEGRKLELRSLENGVFILPPGNKNKQINLTYKVAILHDGGNWPFGYKEAAYVKNEMLMTTGNALFITRIDMDSAQIRFQLPKSYSVTNAWKEIAPNRFLVRNAEELVWTAFTIGKYNTAEIRIGGMKAILVFGMELTDAKKVIETTIQKAVNQYQLIYGAGLAKNHFSGNKTIYIMNVDSSYVGGGAAFVNSISILLNRKPSITNQFKESSWHHILIHEIGHLWNGLSLKTDEKTEWFSEGFTDFVAYKIERDMGLLNDSSWNAIVAKKKKDFEKAREKYKITMDEAGKNKGQYYDIIYSGGFTVALKLDEEIKGATGGQKGLNDFLKTIYAEFGNTQKVLTVDNVQAIAEKTCGCQLDSLFTEHFIQR